MYKIFFKEHYKKIITIFFAILLLDIICIVLVDDKYDNFIPQYIPKDLVYFETDDNNTKNVLEYLENNGYEYEKTISISEKRKPIYSSKIKPNIILENTDFSNEISEEQYINNQKVILNNGTVSQYVMFNLNSTLLTDEKAHFNYNPYNIHSIFGTFPKNDSEVLISENIAVSLLNKGEAESFEELIGLEITNNFQIQCEQCCLNEKYIISGIYTKESFEDTNEYYIINVNDDLKNQLLEKVEAGYIVQINNKDERTIFENSFDFSKVITSEDNGFNYKFVIYILIAMFSNIILLVLMFKDLQMDYLKLRFIGYKKIIIILNLLFPVFIFNLILLFIMIII